MADDLGFSDLGWLINSNSPISTQNRFQIPFQWDLTFLLGLHYKNEDNDRNVATFCSKQFPDSGRSSFQWESGCWRMLSRRNVVFQHVKTIHHPPVITMNSCYPTIPQWLVYQGLANVPTIGYFELHITTTNICWRLYHLPSLVGWCDCHWDIETKPCLLLFYPHDLTRWCPSSLAFSWWVYNSNISLGFIGEKNRTR